MGHASDTTLLVLHGLRLRSFGEPDAIASVVGLDPAVVEAELPALQAAELVLRRDGRLVGWALTPAGRAEQERLLVAELDEVGAREVVEGAYKRFLGLNHDLLTACTAWQMRDETTLNDHTDAAYDAACVDGLESIHEAVVPIADELADLLDRYRGYRPRFEAALAKLRAGDGDWFTKPMIDSYHTVWFQLHEDLLNTLGIDRTSEGSSQ